MHFIIFDVFYNVDSGSLIAKDLLQYAEGDLFIVPGNVSDIMKYHNKAEMMSKYQVFQNPNKNDINLVYAVSKAMPYVTENSKGLLRNLHDSDILRRAFITNNSSFVVNKKCLNKKSGTERFLTVVISERLFNDENVVKYARKHGMTEQLRQEDIEEIRSSMSVSIKDYVYQCLLHKIPVNLMFRSINKLTDEHRKITETIGLQEYKENIDSKNEYLIPDKSRFEKLREILPQEFEWIRNKDRLSLESEIMHHCVYTYDNNIRMDQCAIYSYWSESENKRYTIEFAMKNDKYFVNQIQCKYDKGYSKEIKKYIESFLV